MAKMPSRKRVAHFIGSERFRSSLASSCAVFSSMPLPLVPDSMIWPSGTATAPSAFFSSSPPSPSPSYLSRASFPSPLEERPLAMRRATMDLRMSGVPVRSSSRMSSSSTLSRFATWASSRSLPGDMAPPVLDRLIALALRPERDPSAALRAPGASLMLLMLTLRSSPASRTLTSSWTEMALATSCFFRFRLLMRAPEILDSPVPVSGSAISPTTTMSPSDPLARPPKKPLFTFGCLLAFLSMSLWNRSSKIRLRPGTRSVRSRAKIAAALQCGKRNMARSMLTSWRTRLGRTTEMIRIRRGMSRSTVETSAMRKLKSHASAMSSVVVTPKPIRYAQHARM
mmetsp:Transcript_15118/g.57481  ORF Transcript_15118/g.57481 Transcript_15118/m.57481 type:complete len:341 (+) Transcript_15118:350-1372(+)